ncbi:hypothetical protein KP509_10G075200 [Ceratopteris richardii]|nr:hypothetical protein KP509_10G075200 [Ceratopteris richardii]
MVSFLGKIVDDVTVQEVSEGEELRNVLHNVAQLRLETQNFMAELIVMEAKLLDAHVSKPFVTVMSGLLEEYMRIESSMGDDRNSGFKSMITAFRRMHQILFCDSKLAGDPLNAERNALDDPRSPGKSIQDSKPSVNPESKPSSAIRDEAEIRRFYEQLLEEQTSALRNEYQQQLNGAASAQFRDFEQLLAEKAHAIEQYKGKLEHSIALCRESSDRCSSLQKRVETAEFALQQYSLVDTALYKNEAGPSLLQTRSNAVKIAIQRCAAIVARISQQDSLAVAYPLHIVSCSPESCVEGPKLIRYRKLGMQAVLCQCLFEGFESSTFNMGESTFERPKSLKQERLQAYKKYENEEPDSFEERNSEFRTFVNNKWELLLQKLTDILIHEEPRNVRDRLQDAKTNLTGSFKRLAMSVWLLHLVAFACEPSSAEMFRVIPKSSFDEECMNDDIQTPDHANNTHPEARIVACMTVPGFTVRSSIIKAAVCCAHSLI